MGFCDSPLRSTSSIVIGGTGGDCTVNLINSGIVVRGDTASIQFAVNGDATTLTCRMDRRRIHQCKSDTISVLLS